MAKTKKTKKILIVEDDKDFLWLLRQNFNNQPFSVLYAQDGQEGLAAAQKENPDLILADVLMPKMDGITMIQKLKELGNKSQVIFLTNMKDIDHISSAMEATGESDYIVKSDIRLDVVLERVRKKLGIE